MMALSSQGPDLRFRVKLTLFFITVGSLSPVLASFIRFKPDTEYIYAFHSSTELKSVRTLHAESKIGFVLVKKSNQSSGSQEIYLRVHSAAAASEGKQVLLHEERDFSKWFSFDINENGAIGQVFHPRDEDNHVIEAKKGLVSLLGGNLQHPPEEKVR
ncbi:uncharacterized protein LOC110984470 [Acanthaster planci]|uniref:Uncharacterized protein LOC110984470 n=1 Tax=Acanthaster planci TaxID=133434 RepID=A0A8B7Z6H0_ACAPL|nr:uncharacterized protein LOC110984470 [Acanthaster planci]